MVLNNIDKDNNKINNLILEEPELVNVEIKKEDIDNIINNLNKNIDFILF